MLKPIIDKNKLAQQFGQAAAYYHQHAKVQHYAANRLLQWLEALSIAPGQLLELGCGTGFLSQGLVHLFPEHFIEISDLSPAILQFCQTHLEVPEGQRKRVKFSVLDAETLDESCPDRYRLMVSNFVLQWFQSPVKTIENLCRCLMPGGILLLSFPSAHSFPELKTYCSDRHLPYPLNPLPEFKTIAEVFYRLGLCCEYRMEWYSETYPNLKQTLQHLKDLGAGLNTVRKALSYAQMRHLLTPGENTEVTVSYHIVFLLICP